MPFYDAIYKDEDFTQVLMRHEQSAGHAAEGYAVASGKLGVCCSTSGPGATNLITGLANAYYDSSPILAFSGQVPTQLIGNDAFQEADLIGSTMAITKNNYQVKDIKDLGRMFKEGIYIATSGRPGPVFIDLPKDIQNAECNMNEPIPENIHIIGYNPITFSKGAKFQVKRALDILMKAKYPVIIAGGGVQIANAHEELKKFVDLLKIPVVYTMKGKGVISDENPNVLGMLGMHGRKQSNFAISESDAIIAIGCRFSDRITGKLEEFPGQAGAKIIHVDIDTAEIGKNVPVDVPIVGDARLALQEFNKQAEKRLSKGESTNNWWPKVIGELKKSVGIPNVTKKGPKGRIYPEKVMYELNQVLDPDDIVATEVGQNQMYAAHYLNLRKPRTWLTSGGLGTMGFGFPAAIGAKVAKPDSEVYVVSGDGSFQMNIQELATVKQHGIKVIILVLNNRYLGMVRQWQELFFDSRYAGTCLGKACETGEAPDLEYWPDFVQVAEAYGLQGLRVEDPMKVRGAIEQARESEETFVIDFQIEEESNILPMLAPGAAINKFITRKRDQKSLYDWFNRLPRTKGELEKWTAHLTEEDAYDVYK